MAKGIEITEEEILKARSYMPIESKESITRLFAQLCTERVENPNSSAIRPLPPVYRENRRLRHQMCMGILAKLYLGREIKLQKVSIEAEGEVSEKLIDCCMETEEYDQWAGSHVINQMERMKASKTEGVRNKVFDLLYDFKGFENMFLGAIKDELEMRNDFTDRFTKLMDMQTSPETLEEARKLLEIAEKELEKAGGKK